MLGKTNPIITYEGETERWYFEWLQHLINKTDGRCLNVEFDFSKTLSPDSYAKRVSALFDGQKWYHLIDRESASDSDTARFRNSIESLKRVRSIKSCFSPILGYSNSSFELWMLLHIMDYRRSTSCAEDYWKDLKKGFHLDDVSKFEFYKSEDVFKKILSGLTIENVIQAIKRAEALEKDNQKTETLKRIGKYEYYDNSPSLSVHKVVKDILKDVGLLKKSNKTAK